MDMSKMTSGVPMVRIDGAKVRNLREAKGLTQLFLATSVEVTTDTISRWENKRYPTIKKENGLKLAEALEVELEEILESTRQEEAQPASGEQPAVDFPPASGEESDGHLAEESAPEPAPPAAKPPSRKKFAAAGILLLALLIFLVWWFYPVSEQFTITASRLLPKHAVAGQPFPVAIHVASNSTASLSLIVRESLPEGASLLSAVPAYSDYDAKAEEVKWLRKIDGSQVFAYMVKVAQPDGPAAFSGKVALPKGAGQQIDVSGDSVVQISPFHWADANADGRISDEEILTVYDEFSDIKGLAINIDQVEEIWLGSGYVWNAEKKRFEVLP
ncbi:MAG: helix-turn-helix domain-containing protein [Desulfobulbaceae bacterium]|nr:helix-turn-helix domain-containing protein [Desulfobulbaceae bacterium]